MAKGTGRYHPPKILIMVPEFFYPTHPCSRSSFQQWRSFRTLGLNRINFWVNFRSENKDFKLMGLWWGGSSGYWLLVTSLVNVAGFFGWCCNLQTNLYFWDLTVMLLEHAGDDRHVGDWETGKPQEGSAWLPETEGHQLRDAQRGCCHQVPLTFIGQLWTLTPKVPPSPNRWFLLKYS